MARRHDTSLPSRPVSWRALNPRLVRPDWRDPPLSTCRRGHAPLDSCVLCGQQDATLVLLGAAIHALVSVLAALAFRQLTTMARLLVLVAVAALVAFDGVHAACGPTVLRTVDAAQWRVVCTDSSAFVPFVPSGAASFVLDAQPAARVVPSTGDVILASAFSRVDTLKSDVITSITIKAAPLWVHTTPVVISPSAFAQLPNLETLYLQDVPLANAKLHLQLPVSIKKIVIVGCKLEAFSFEIVDDEEPTELVEIDLHANELESIPDVFYTLPSSVVNLDIRLNKLSVISVTTSDLPMLKRWMKRGMLQIDNPKGPCPPPGEEALMLGLSQEFDVCVFEDGLSASDEIEAALAGQSLDGSEDALQNVTDSSSQVSRDVDTVVDVPSATDESPTDEAALLPSASRPGSDSLVNTPISQSSSTKPDSSSAYIAVGAGAVATVLLATMMVAMAASRSRDSLISKESEIGYRGKSLTSLFSAAVTEDLATQSVAPRRSSEDNSSSESIAVIPLPTFTNQTRSTGRPDPIVRSSSDAVTPIGREARSSQYANLSTPQNDKPQPFVMSRSLQSLIGVSHYTITSLEKESQLRQVNKQKLRAFLSKLAKERATIDINSTRYICFGEVKESGLGALTVRCHQVLLRTDSNRSTSPLLLKVYVEQDIRHAIREYRALLVMQSNTCSQFVSQMVATEMEKKIDGMLCAALVIEAGTASSFRHVVRGQIDRTKQFEVVQQLYNVIKALECLHDRQFIHGGLHLDALLAHPAEVNRLKFRDLEHATRFGDIIPSDISSSSCSLEYMPPEMAHHLVSCGEGPRPPHHDTMDDDVYRVLRASPSYDVWCFGIMILKVYANTKQLDEFKDCETPSDFYATLTDETFNFEHSLQFYVHHDDVRDLARVCLRPDPRKRPRLTGLLNHRVFRAYDRLEEGELVMSFRAHQMRKVSKERELMPPSLWLFLPPRELGLTETRSVDDWVSDLTDFQELQRQERRHRSPEMLFPLLYLCEDSRYVSTPCTSRGFHHAALHLPASLLSLAMPLVQESTLFLEAKSILSEDPELSLADVSGLSPHEWTELMKFYRALEKLMLAPISSFSLLLLKPLEEMLASQDREQARQVLDELKCLVFSQEKRDHVLSLLDILRTISVNSDLASDDIDIDDDEESDDEGCQRASKEWCRLRKCEMDKEVSMSMPSTRWLCRRHWECEMECEV